MEEDHASLKIILQNQQKYLEGQEQTFHERVQAEVWNRLYRFLASDPDFNPVDGMCKFSRHGFGASIANRSS